MTQSYSELLKHPKWQKKRLEVLERAGFECEYCGDKEATLHVHHGYYEKGKKPWEYDIETLHCLCDSCHGYFHDIELKIRNLIGGICFNDIEKIWGYIVACQVENLNMCSGRHYRINFESCEFIEGVSDFFRQSHLSLEKEAHKRGGYIVMPIGYDECQESEQ